MIRARIWDDGTWSESAAGHNFVIHENDLVSGKDGRIFIRTSMKQTAATYQQLEEAKKKLPER